MAASYANELESLIRGGGIDATLTWARDRIDALEAELEASKKKESEADDENTRLQTELSDSDDALSVALADLAQARAQNARLERLRDGIGPFD